MLGTGSGDTAMVRRTIAAFALVAAAAIQPALADQAVLGQKLQLRDPQPGTDATMRKVVICARERTSPDTPVGDPSTGGATLSLFVAASGTGDTQYVPLPAAGWKPKGTGWAYKDASGSAGPVRIAQIGKSHGGTLRMKMVALAKVWPLSFPPLPATRACLTFAIDGGDLYHVDFPPPPDATVSRSDATAFLVRNPVAEGYCYPPPPTTTTSTSTTTTTNPNAFCGDGYRDPGEQCDGGPACTLDCVQDIPSCCSTATQCQAAPLFSLNFYLMQFCQSQLGVDASGIWGGICAPDGSCAAAAIDPVPMCCQLVGSCNGNVVTSTAGLWSFQNVCRGAQSGTHVINAVCGPAGVCLPQ